MRHWYYDIKSTSAVILEPTQKHGHPPKTDQIESCYFHDVEATTLEGRRLPREEQFSHPVVEKASLTMSYS